MNAKIIMLSCSLVAFAAMGADTFVDWLNVANGDLAVGANWDGGNVPVLQTSADYLSQVTSPIARFYAKHQWQNGTPVVVTASQDLSFKEIRIDNVDSQRNAKQWYETIFDLGANHTIETFGGPYAGFYFGAIHGGYHRFTLKSGTIRASENNPGTDKIKIGGTEYSNNRIFRMNAGVGYLECFIDGPNSRFIYPQINFGGSGDGYRFCVTNGAYAEAKLWINSAAMTGSVLQVSGVGSVLNCKSELSYILPNSINVTDAKPDADVTILVNDGGMITNFHGCVHFGCNAKFIVDGGTFHVRHYNDNPLVIGSRVTVTNTLFEVKNNGLYCGRQGTGYGRADVVLDHGFNNKFYVHSGGRCIVDSVGIGTGPNGSGENEFIVGPGGYAEMTNLVIGLKNVQYGKTGTNCAMRVTGEKARLQFKSLRLKGWENKFEVSDHGFAEATEDGTSQIQVFGTCSVTVKDYGTFLVNKGIQIGRETRESAGGDISSNTVLTVTNGGNLICPEMQIVELGWPEQRIADGDGYTGNFNNRIYVGDNGNIETYRLRIYGYGNGVTISNGFVNVAGEEFRTTYSNTKENGGNTDLTIEGNNSQLLAPKGVNIWRDATLTFRVPKGGYQRSAIVGAGGFAIASESRLVIDVEEDRTANESVLVESGKALQIPADILDAARENLPENAKLIVSDDGKKLILKRKARNGFVLIVK